MKETGSIKRGQGQGEESGPGNGTRGQRGGGGERRRGTQQGQGEGQGEKTNRCDQGRPNDGPLRSLVLERGDDPLCPARRRSLLLGETNLHDTESTRKTPKHPELRIKHKPCREDYQDSNRDKSQEQEPRFPSNKH